VVKELAARYQRLIDYFVPDSIREDRDASNQARMFLISHTMGPILGNSVPTALFFVDPTPGLDILVLAISITSFWVFPFLLRRGTDYNTLVAASVLNLNFCIFWSCYFNGGVLSPTLPWVLLIPILSFFYIGGNTRLQGGLMAIFAGSFALFLLLFYTTTPPLNDIPEVALVALGVVSTVAALCYVATMAIYYARIFDAGVELEQEVRRRRLATDKLRTAIVAADEAGLHKAEFLARMSHELRTPLNAVIGYSEILKEDALQSDDLQMRDDVDRIHDAGQYLLRLINIILDLSKIEAGRMQFTVEAHNLVDIVHEATSRVRPAMRNAGNTLELFIEARETMVDSDSERLLQILNAILDNVPVHAPGAHVEVRCRDAVAGPISGFEISISDNGNGIRPERLETLFESLADRRDAAASKYGGTGLNLTIVHKLAHAMGCRLTAESVLGKGSCFKVFVPREWARPQSVAAAALAQAAA
jgi:signal transduction histidine kinase